MRDIFDEINRLQLEGNCYYIDYLPEKLLSERFADLEEYLYKNHLNDFSKKISKIVIILISYYDAEIYLTEFPDRDETIRYSELYGQDIRRLPLQYIDNVISYIIKNDISSVQIYFRDTPFLVSVNGGFSVDIYGAKGKELNLISQLATQENLYLKQEE